MSQGKLLRDPKFWPLFWTQFWGAFNDNFFKNALIIMITFKAARIWGLPPQQMVAFSAGVFILPFFIFSATAGQLADRTSKSTLIRWIKLAEILVMLAGAYGFYTERLEFLVAVLFFMGLQSAFFGPVKFSALPQILTEKELVGGNALVEMGTFLAILIGTIIGGVTIAQEGGHQWVALGVVAFAIVGYLMSLFIRPLAPESPDLEIKWNPVTPTWEIFSFTQKNRTVFLSILGISWFWFFGASFLSLFPTYCKEVLYGNENLVTFFLALFSLGIGAGSLLCERLSREQLELGLVPLGSIGMSLFALDLFIVGSPYAVAGFPLELQSITQFLNGPHGWRITFDMLALACFSGFYIVPLQTLIQQRSEPSHRSRVIAGNNILNALFMVVSAGMLMLLFSWKFTVPQIIGVLALLNLATAVYIYTLIPEFLFRFISWLLANLLYRLQISGETGIPKTGAAVLVCNHVSFVDWLIIASATKRPIRFVMDAAFTKLPFVSWVFRDAKVIPIASAKRSPEILETAFQRISEELKEGELVCIFPEGRLTDDGKLGDFRRGIERILEKDPVPVIPMALIGMWGSFFSRRHGGKAMRKPFHRLWSRVRLRIGQPVAAQAANASGLQERVARLLQA